MRNRLYSYTQDYINRWIVSYADFVTMLLALFMVLYALSQMNINYLNVFSNSIGNAFEISSPQIDFNKLDKAEILKQKRELLRIFSTTDVKLNTSDIDISDQKNQMNILKNQINNVDIQIAKESVEFKNIEGLIKKKLGNIKGVTIKRESRGLVISLKDSLLFDQGSDIIKDKTKATLDKLSGILKEIPNPIRIEGHTDNQPINTARFPSNWELSTARATNLVRYLINNKNFNPGKLSAVGYGEYVPIKTNATKEGRAANRRVDIVVLSSTSKIFEPPVNKE